ncbi:MAG: LutC/YkgG family protein [Planctomycetaceae bacterium]
MDADTSRQAILDRLRARPIDAAPLPSVDPARTVHYEDPVAKFTEMLTWVGGRVHLVSQASEIIESLNELPEFQTASSVASTLPEIAARNVHLDELSDPHALVSVDWSILPGEFCVAENGAIWVSPKDLLQRTLIFIAQHLALVVSRSQMVMQMHDAYRRIQTSDSQQQGAPRFGVFVSGPSKTADIEQSLVLGAHGCRTLEVFLLP